MSDEQARVRAMREEEANIAQWHQDLDEKIEELYLMQVEVRLAKERLAALKKGIRKGAV